MGIHPERSRVPGAKTDSLHVIGAPDRLIPRARRVVRAPSGRFPLAQGRFAVPAVRTGLSGPESVYKRAIWRYTLDRLECRTRFGLVGLHRTPESTARFLTLPPAPNCRPLSEKTRKEKERVEHAIDRRSRDGQKAVCR